MPGGRGGAGSLTLAGTNQYKGNTFVSAGTLNITGSLAGVAGSTALRYGDTAGNTIVNLSGFITTGANVAGSVAVFNQTGGSVTIVPPNSQDQQYLANNGGYGMLKITGGTFNTARFDGVGAAGNAATAAVIYVSGSGTLNENVGDWFLPIRTNGMMSMTVAPGGSFTCKTAVSNRFSERMYAYSDDWQPVMSEKSSSESRFMGGSVVSGPLCSVGRPGLHFSSTAERAKAHGHR